MKKEFEVTRTKEDGSTETVKCYVATPKNSSLGAADRYRAKVFNQCLMDGIFTKAQLSKVLIERGVWSEEKEKEERKINEEIAATEKELFLGSGNKKAKLSDLILRDTYLNANILNVTEQTIKKALEDNMYHFKQDRRIRFQIFNPNKKYF
jgi:hypothetical protein